MRHLLDLVYLIALILLSPWLLYKVIRTRKYRHGLWQKFSGSSPRLLVFSSPRHRIWFHGVSVGEIHLLRQVVARFRQRHPDWECIISTTTDTGMEEARKRFPDLPVFFWPLDFSWAVRRALHNVRPNLVVLAECELWPNFLMAAKRQAVPVTVINGRMSPRSLRRYQRLGRLVRWLLGRVDLFAMQNAEYADRIRELGADPERVQVTGNIKYDGVETDRTNPRTLQLRQLLDIQPEELVWIAGSTQAPEEEISLDIFRRVRTDHPNLRLFLVPRQRDRFDEVARFLERSGLPFVRRSALDPRSSILNPRSSILLMDTIGELGALWGLADIAFVGGSLDGRRGGQNMIEPAAYGAAVVFGPHVWNFRQDVERLLSAQAAIQVAEGAELEAVMRRLLGDAVERHQRGEAARRLVFQQQGATERTLDHIDQLLSERVNEEMAA